VHSGGEDVLSPTFTVPRGPKTIVVRPRLFDLVDLGVQGPMTLVAAPAGAGKSALMSSWIATGRSPGPVRWLSPEGGDADRRRFASTVLAAFADAPAERTEPAVLVIDDFDEVADVVVEELERFVRLPPPGVRLVLVTRADPPVGLGRLRLDGRLTEIRARDLAFTFEEARVLFGILDVDITPEEMASLWALTEGWAAGLCLAAMSARSHPDSQAFVEQFAGADAAVSDYLVREVLTHQPSEVRDFLLRTSIVELVCGELADALTGGSDGQQMLVRLEHAGVPLAPVAVDEHAVWHRYHPLFGELLRAELRLSLADELGELHRRAARWLAANGDLAGALRHVTEGRAWALGAELVVDGWIDLLIAGDMAAVRPVLEAMPRRRVAANPELSLAAAAAMLALDGAEAAEPYLRAAEGAPARVAPERRARVAAASAAVELYAGRVHGDPADALARARELLDREAVLDDERTTPGLRAFVLAQLGVAELWTGDLDAAVQHLEQARGDAGEDPAGRTVLTATAHLALANLLRGEFARARRRADDALAIAERGGGSRTEATAVAHSVLAGLCIQRDELDDAQRLLTLAGAGVRQTHDRSLRALHALNRVVLLADRGEHAAALDLLRATRDQLGDWPVSAPLDDLVTAREGLLLAATGAPDAARALLERGTNGSLAIANATATLDLLDGEPAAARAVLAGHLDANGASIDEPCPARAEAWLLDALALDEVADHAQAARSLEHALDLSEPGVLRRIVVGQGAAAGSLLRRHARYDTAHPQMVAEAIDALERRCRAADRRAPTALAEPLSEREQAILRYLPTTMSNQEIAGELFVSVNTIKTHLKAIYRKLDVPGRREAVEAARALGLMA